LVYFAKSFCVSFKIIICYYWKIAVLDGTNFSITIVFFSQSKTAIFLFGNSSPEGTTREGELGEEYAGVPTIRAKRLARLQLGTLAAALAAEPKVFCARESPLLGEVY